MKRILAACLMVISFTLTGCDFTGSGDLLPVEQYEDALVGEWSEQRSSHTDEYDHIVFHLDHTCDTSQGTRDWTLEDTYVFVFKEDEEYDAFKIVKMSSRQMILKLSLGPLPTPERTYTKK